MLEDGQDDALLGIQIIRFGKFELDARSGELRSHGLRVRLQEQPLRILLMLLEHPGEVVTREQIRQRLWPDGTFVDFDHSINAAIKRLRDALGESVTRQHYLQTLPRRGYRFIGEIASMPVKVQTVGRAKERAQLLAGMASANAGNGLLLCVSGEAGIGKTALVEQFVAETKRAQSCLVGRGRCSERLAGTGAWLPWLEVLDALLADAALTGHNTSQSTIHELKEFAPTWSALVAPAISEPASHAAPSQERLKREMCAFLQHVSRFEPIVIFMDDLHWADASSGDLLTYLTDRLDSMRVLVLVAYRTSDLVLSGHPFLHAKPSLEAHGRCHEIALDFLSSQEVGTYTALRFPDHRFPSTFVSLIHERTEGNPLFMVDMLRDLHQRGVVRQSALGWELKEPIARIAREVPSSVQGMIEHKIQLMHEHQALLHLAAVQGYEFDSAIVAEVLRTDATTIEERLGHLERVHQFIRSIGERDLPDQTPSQRYRFVHVLYQNVLYASLGPARRATESKAVAEALLAHYGNRAGEIATELAFLFEAARDPMRAATYFQIASERAVANASNREAVTLGRRGLQLLKSAPEGPDRDCSELLLYTTFGGALIATAGFDAEETARVFLRAHELCEKFGDSEQRFAVAWGLACVESVSGDAPQGFEMGAQMLRLAEEANDTGLRVAAHYVLGDLHYWRPHYQESMYHLEEAISLYHQPEHHAIGQKLLGYDPGVASIGLRAIALWYLGFPDQALRGVARAKELASLLKSPICSALTDFFTAIIHILRREPELALSFAERALSVSGEEGFDYFEAGSLVELGWAMSLTGSSAEGIRKIREGLKLSQSIGGTLERPFLLYALAECLARTGHSEEALAVVEAGIDLARRAASHFHTPELLCLKANLLAHLIVPNFEEAEQCVCEALQMTRESGAKSLELRAAVSLCHLQRKYDRPKEWETLAGVAGFFTEGFDTMDIKDAKALLASQGAAT